MLVTEYRIPLPLSIEEYEIGRLFTINEMSKQETGGGEGVEILINEPFTNSNSTPELSAGQYTYKIYHFSKKVPWFIRKLAPHGNVKLHEESWNAYPYCKTELNVYNLDEGFSITIQTQIIADDVGLGDNVFGLTTDQLKKRNVIGIDIVNDSISDPLSYDPSTFKSIKGNRGPIVGNWIENHKPILTCYKLVTAEFEWFGLKPRIEKLIQSTEKRLFYIFHRMLICTMDVWYDLSIQDIRDIENLTAIQLHKQRFEGSVQGLVVKE